MITIGILGSRGKSAVADIINSELKKRGKHVCIIGTKEESIREFVKLLNNDIEYAVIEISREDILQGNISRIKFNIIIQTSLEQEQQEIVEGIRKILSNVKEGGYIIFNSESVQKIDFKCDNIYPITYGLNGKNTVTASSIDDIDGLDFSYCIQRALFTISQAIVQPCEIPIKAEGKYDDVGYYLAAYTCITILGFLL